MITMWKSGKEWIAERDADGEVLFSGAKEEVKKKAQEELGKSYFTLKIRDRERPKRGKISEKAIHEAKGGELNALVEEHIFGRCGHHLTVLAKDNRDRNDDYTTYRCRKCGEGYRGLSYRENMFVCESYSSSMSDAWKIANELNKRDDSVAKWMFADELSQTFVLDLTPEQICKAAIRAVRAEAKTKEKKAQ